MSGANNQSGGNTSKSDFSELLAGLHARSPAEIMGAAATSSLLGSTLLSTIGWLAAVLGLTLVVALLGGGPLQTTKEVATPATETTSPATPQAAPTSTDAAVATEDVQDDGDAAASAAEAMGIDQATDSDAEPKPLEDRLNQLLDGLE